MNLQLPFIQYEATGGAVGEGVGEGLYLLSTFVALAAIERISHCITCHF